MSVPPDLRGRRRHDPLLVALNGFFTGVQKVRSLRPAYLPPVERVDRDLALVVRQAHAVADEVMSIVLAAPNGAVLPAWQPGCHLDLRLPSGLRRQYSLYGDPADRRTYRIATRLIKDGGGGSAEVHRLRPGDRVTVQGPRNAFPFLDRQRYLFLAGGIGITPILPMVRAAERAGADWRLVYTGRSRASLPFLGELAELGGAAANAAARVIVRTDDVDGAPDATAWLQGVALGTAVYCCGPSPMLDAVRAAVPPSATLHYERFAPPPIVDGRPFTLELVRSGVTVEVPADRSALAVVRERLPEVPYSCRQGFCGTCRVGVLAGETDDSLDDSMLLCVSRAVGDRLRVDL